MTTADALLAIAAFALGAVSACVVATRLGIVSVHVVREGEQPRDARGRFRRRDPRINLSTEN